VSTPLPTINGIRAAAKLLAPPFSGSPLYRSVQLSHWFDADIWLKVESINPIASFKCRGATNAIAAATASGAVTEIVTSSTGNHGQGVALASSLLGVTCHVFMPAEPNPVKLAMIESLGAIVHKVGEDLDFTKPIAIQFAAERGSFFVDDGDDMNVIEGAGTVGLEIAEALDHVDEVFLPMGSGTFASGCAAALKALHPGVRAITVQSAESPAMAASFAAGHAVELPAHSFADGLECRVPAQLALDCVLALIDEVITVPDADLLRSIRSLIEVQHLVAEPAGAAALAGAATRREQLAGKTVVLVVSGGNLTPALFERAIAGPGLIV
jgi:threonine dehydratase